MAKKSKTTPVKKNGDVPAWVKVVAVGAGVVGICCAIGSTGDAAQADTAKTEKTAATSKVQHTDLEERCLKVGKAVTKYGITGNDRARFMAISAAENKCDKGNNAGTNHDGTVDDCALQINRTANADLIKGRDLNKLDDCVHTAVDVLHRQGWNAWSTYDHGRGTYRQFVPMALKLEAELS